jgi:hypothetical protein
LLCGLWKQKPQISVAGKNRALPWVCVHPKLEQSVGVLRLERTKSRTSQRALAGTTTTGDFGEEGFHLVSNSVVQT